MGLFWVDVGQKDKFDMPTAKVGRSRNTPLESGVYKYSRSQMYHKKAIYKFAKKKTPKPAAEKKPVFVEKKVGGAKNGGTRKVATVKPKFDYPTSVKIVNKTSKNLFSKQKRSLRAEEDGPGGCGQAAVGGCQEARRRQAAEGVPEDRIRTQQRRVPTQDGLLTCCFCHPFLM